MTDHELSRPVAGFVIDLCRAPWTIPPKGFLNLTQTAKSPLLIRTLRATPLPPAAINVVLFRIAGYCQLVHPPVPAELLCSGSFEVGLAWPEGALLEIQFSNGSPEPIAGFLVRISVQPMRAGLLS